MPKTDSVHVARRRYCRVAPPPNPRHWFVPDHDRPLLPEDKAKLDALVKELWGHDPEKYEKFSKRQSYMFLSIAEDEKRERERRRRIVAQQTQRAMALTA